MAAALWLLFGTSPFNQYLHRIDCLMLLPLLLTFGSIFGIVKGVLEVQGLHSIKISSLGLELPEAFLFNMRLRRKRKWTELVSLTTVKSSGTSPQQESVQLAFTDGCVCKIPRDQLLPEQIEILTGYATKYSSASIDDTRDEQSTLLMEKVVSYTRLWEESARFRSSVFVPLTPGQKINQNRVDILRLLQTSAMAATYLGRLDNEHLVVVKEAVVAISTTEGERARELFQRECGYLLKLDHPQIVKVIDHVVESERDYLILEWISGEDLRSYTRKNGPAQESLALSWLLQTSKILEYLHGQEPPIIHRDVSPENLMITPSGKIVLIDFGAANYFVENATGTMIGKHGYVAPEQLYGKAEPVSDLYGLGATMFFVLTGLEPTALTETPDLPSVSKETELLLKRLTKLDASQRISSASAVATAVEESINNIRTQQVDS